MDARSLGGFQKFAWLTRWLIDKKNLNFWMKLVGTICWGVCFWWMDQLRAQGKRIEKLSQIEHDLIKEVHPQVGEIKEGMETMIAVVKENSENDSPVSKKKGH